LNVRVVHAALVSWMLVVIDDVLDVCLAIQASAFP
jgi:hypothetical protein